MKTPDLSPKPIELDLSYVNRLLGADFSEKEAVRLLGKMRLGVEKTGKKKGVLTVLVPAYRTDILHPFDLVEDIAIAYGYQNFVPEIPRIATIGMKSRLESFSDTVRELALGCGFSEVMTLIMTNKTNLFTRMRLPEEPVVETENPVSIEHSVGRTWLIPSLLSVLEKNKNREYPQRLFELGDCLASDGKEKRALAGVIAHSKTNYSENKSVVVGILENLGIEPKIGALKHPSFIEGRCASLGYGFLGEIHPEVLESFGLEVPVSAFELDLGALRKSIKSLSSD